MNGKRLAMASLIAVALLTVAFIPLSGQVGMYDPWLDINDDGKIDGKDIAGEAKNFGARGNPFVAKAGLEYDSGWLNITDKAGQCFTVVHNLNSTDVIVDITGRATIDGGVHQRNLGGTGYAPGWNKTYGGTGDDEAWSMIQTNDGGYAIAGYTGSFGAGSWDFWLVKTDSVGNMQWNRTYGGTGSDVAWSVVQTNDGGYVLTGSTSSFGAGNGDFWLVKTESWLFGLVWTDSTNNSITLYRGATDAYWNYVRVRIWKIKETP